jgi:hypothetical protein
MKATAHIRPSIRRSSVASYILNDKMISPTMEMKATGQDLILMEIRDRTAHITMIKMSMSPRTRFRSIPPEVKHRGNCGYGHNQQYQEYNVENRGVF